MQLNFVTRLFSCQYQLHKSLLSPWPLLFTEPPTTGWLTWLTDKVRSDLQRCYALKHVTNFYFLSGLTMKTKKIRRKVAELLKKILLQSKTISARSNLLINNSSSWTSCLSNRGCSSCSWRKWASCISSNYNRDENYIIVNYLSYILTGLILVIESVCLS